MKEIRKQTEMKVNFFFSSGAKREQHLVVSRSDVPAEC